MVLRVMNNIGLSGMYPLPHDPTALASMKTQLQVFIFSVPGVNCCQGIAIRVRTASSAKFMCFSLQLPHVAEREIRFRRVKTQNLKLLSFLLVDS
jgi:hypothetical protein